MKHTLGLKFYGLMLDTDIRRLWFDQGAFAVAKALHVRNKPIPIQGILF